MEARGREAEGTSCEGTEKRIWLWCGTVLLKLQDGEQWKVWFPGPTPP